jgi:hypothetical protein
MLLDLLQFSFLSFIALNSDSEGFETDPSEGSSSKIHCADKKPLIFAIQEGKNCIVSGSSGKLVWLYRKDVEWIVIESIDGRDLKEVPHSVGTCHELVKDQWLREARHRRLFEFSSAGKASKNRSPRHKYDAEDALIRYRFLEHFNNSDEIKYQLVWDVTSSESTKSCTLKRGDEISLHFKEITKIPEGVQVESMYVEIYDTTKKRPYITEFRSVFFLSGFLSNFSVKNFCESVAARHGFDPIRKLVTASKNSVMFKVYADASFEYEQNFEGDNYIILEHDVNFDYLPPIQVSLSCRNRLTGNMEQRMIHDDSAIVTVIENMNRSNPKFANELTLSFFDGHVANICMESVPYPGETVWLSFDAIFNFFKKLRI